VPHFFRRFCWPSSYRHYTLAAQGRWVTQVHEERTPDLPFQLCVYTQWVLHISVSTPTRTAISAHFPRPGNSVQTFVFLVILPSMMHNLIYILWSLKRDFFNRGPYLSVIQATVMATTTNDSADCVLPSRSKRWKCHVDFGPEKFRRHSVYFSIITSVRCKFSPSILYSDAFSF
jgi:hypothetical protein